VSGTTAYTWNARNQLSSISGPAGAASFQYDAQGRRIEKTVNGVTTGFLYDGAQAIAELKGSALDTVYQTGLEIDEVLARYAPLGNKTLLTDALTSVIAQANDDETVSNFYAYSPYGETVALGADEGNALQYTGRENDGTGLYYYRARYYDAVLKRFIGEDPIGLAGGDVNLYAFVTGNPLSFTDPTGHQAGGKPPPVDINNLPKPPKGVPTTQPPGPLPPKAPPPPGMGCGAAFRICTAFCITRCPGGPLVKAICEVGCVAIWIACMTRGGGG
jgi:RHS repeat-associated protein